MSTTARHTSRNTTSAPSTVSTLDAGHEAIGRHAAMLEVGADPGHRRGGSRGLHERQGSRPGQVDRDLRRDPARSRRHDDDAVGDEHRLGDAVGDHDDRGRGAVPEPQELEVEAFAGHRIERAERLVEEQDLGGKRQRPGERDALACAAGQLGWAGRDRGRIQSDQVDQLGQSSGPTIRGQPSSSSG